jgi:hypothetical protein
LQHVPDGQGTYAVELYLKVRLAVLEGMSRRQAAKHFNISCDSISEMLSYSTPPCYRRQAAERRPKLDALISIIDRWLENDVKVPRKQRHTAERVFDRLGEECRFTGGYTIIKDYMRERDQYPQVVFVPLSHPPGHAQADFGEAMVMVMVMVGGVEQKSPPLHARPPGQRRLLYAGVSRGCGRGVGRWSHPCLHLLWNGAAVDRL